MRKVASGYKLIFGYLGLFIIFVGIATLLPLLAIPFFPNEVSDWYCFAIPGGGAIVLGALLFSLIAKKTKSQLGKHQDSILLVLVWITAILISAIPFIIKGKTFTNSVFETTSAYATVGLSVFETSDYGLHLFVLYRSILCFVGGIGLVLVVTSAISDRYGLKLYLAEGHNDKLMPNLARSARLMLTIYVGITAMGAVLYTLAGMPVFDAIVHSISAVATGGFSSRPEGLMAFAANPNFWAIQLITVLLMILGAMNFLIHMFILTGRFKKAIKDCEVKLFGILLLIFIPLFFIAAFAAQGWKDPLNALSTGSFTFISALTTTGFTNVSGVFGSVATITKIGQGVLFLVVIVNIIGGGMGSTAGGVKQYRVAVIGKSFYWVTKEKLGSSNCIYPHYVWRFGEQKEIDLKDAVESFGYMFIYVILLFIGALFISVFDKYTFGESLFEFSNALSSTGMSNGICSAGNLATKWILIFGMFAGRLEILGIYFAFYRVLRDIFRKETI